MNLSSSNKSLTRQSSHSKLNITLFPPLLHQQCNFQNPPLPRKYKRIPRRIDHQEIKFNFPSSLVKNYRFKSNQNIQEYRSQYKIGRSLHEKTDNNEGKKQLCFSSKKNIIENKNGSVKIVDNVGKDTFYKMYTHKTRTQHHSAEKSLIQGILDDLDKYALIPKGIEDLRQSQHKRIQFKRQALNNNNRLKLIGNVIQKSGKYSRIDLSDNLIKQNSSKIIIDKLVGVENVNLSGNEIGATGITSLCILFSNSSCGIRNLNVSNNNLSDGLIQSLLKSVKKQPLSVLDLSRNHANRKTCIQLKSLVKMNNLIQLYVGWNKIDSTSAYHLIEGVKQSISLKYLNLAWNSIGNSQKLKQSLCKMLKKNQQLIHLDLSYCSITPSQYEAISTALYSNQTLIGLHCEGSCAFVDTRGYLNITYLNKTFYEPELVSKYPAHESKLKQVPVCWICQEWRQFRFEIKLKPQQQKQKKENYSIHFSFQNYQKMPLETINNTVYIQRCVPPIQFMFFVSYQLQGKQVIQLSNKYEKVKKRINYGDQIINEVNIHKQENIINFSNLNSSIVPRNFPQISFQSGRQKIVDY